MEDTLREVINYVESRTNVVLILVLMEDTLRVCWLPVLATKHIVLILVLMEDTLRVYTDTVVCVLRGS